MPKPTLAVERKSVVYYIGGDYYNTGEKDAVLITYLTYASVLQWHQREGHF